MDGDYSYWLLLSGVCVMLAIATMNLSQLMHRSNAQTEGAQTPRVHLRERSDKDARVKSDNFNTEANTAFCSLVFQWHTTLSVIT